MSIIYYNENGLITGAALNMQPEENRLWVQSDVVPTSKLSSDFYVSLGNVIERPQLNILENYNLIVNQEITLVGIPADTEVFTNGIYSGTTDGTDVLLSFDIDGNYSLRFRPPFPYKEKTTQVSVT